jgi:hypothetical protein
MMETLLKQPARTFRLADEVGAGVACDETGVFVGEIPLLERTAAVGRWRSRPLDDLNVALTERYGLQVDLACKVGGLAFVARALDDGDFARAQIATLHLGLPDPPAFYKASIDQVTSLADRLEASGVLAKTFDDTKHPRWPAESPGGVGGQFAPVGSGAADAMDAGARSSDGPAQRPEQSTPTPVGYLEPTPHATMSAGNQALMNAINELRAGDGSRLVFVDGVLLNIRRSGAEISLTVDGALTLHGVYSDRPGVAGFDIRNIQILSSLRDVSFQVLPDTPGGSTELDAEIRIDTQVTGYAADGRPILKSVVAVRYNHTVAVNNRPRWRRGQFYGIWHWGGL